MGRKPLRALVLEDVEDDAILVVRELGQQGFDVTWERAQTAAAMRALLDAKSWDVVLSDYSMPGFDAPSALLLLQESGQDLPFIVVSGTIGEEAAVAAMKHGAHDYLMKGSLKRLGAAIERELREAEVRREHRLAVDKIQHMNRVLRAIRNVNQLIVQEKDSERLLEQATQMLVETRGYTSVLCVHLDDDQQPNFVAHTLAANESAQSSRDTIRSNGLTGCMKQALKNNQIVAFESDAPECSGCPLASYYPNQRRLARGLVHDGRAHGVLVIALPEGMIADAEERDLLEEMTRDIAFALHGIETDRLHKESLERFRIITESSPDAIFIADQAGNYTYVNTAASRLLGYSADELTKMNIADVSVKDRRDENRQFFGESLAKGYLVADIELVRKDGTIVPVDLNSITLPNGEVYGSCRDVTERKRAGEALKASEKRYRRLFEAAKDGILILDADTGMVVDVNPFMTALTGYSHEDFLDKYLWDIGFFKDVIASKAAFAELQAKHYVRYDDLPMECRDGRRLDVEFVSNVYEVDDQKIIQCNIRDITEMRLMRAQIAQSDRLATMGTLAAGVAHEINNPLAYILYNLESLADDLPKLSSALRRCLGQLGDRLGHDEWTKLLGPDQDLLNPSMLDDIQARFKDALQGSHRIRDVARGLGTFSRVERDRVVPVALTHVIEVAINMAFNEIKYRARLVKEYGRTSTIMANDGRLSQVFLNLLINAAHAITDGDVDHNEIKVRTWQAGDEVFAEVRDTGKGIAKEHLPRLFEPFFTTKQIGVGTGLGLSISKNIVEEYGGRIEVESELGKGTRFVVRLPVKKAEDMDEAPQTEQVLAHPKVRGRILVVDDEAGIRAAMVRMLRGHDVVQAVSGSEAQKILEVDQAFDLILCDMMMPIMSGVDLHEWLLATHPDLAKQVVFITGGAFTPRAAQYLAKVSNIRLEKPFDVANFKKIVDELIVAYRNRGS